MSDTDVDRLPDRAVRLRRAGTCRVCSAALPAGQVAVVERATRTVRCVACPSVPAAGGVPTPAAPPAVETGVAGASAQREHDRRAARREERIRAAHPRLGGVVLALTDDPQSTRAWGSGAVGERKVADALDRWAAQGVLVLHDRRIPRTRANIDHVAVAPGGVFVIDAKRYRGRPELRVQGGLLRPRTRTLVVGGRDCTRLVEGVHRQVDVVRAALAATHPDVPVRGMLCFVDADWPLVGGAFTVDDVDVLWPRKAAQALGADGPLTDGQVVAVHAALAAAFPVA